MDKKLFGLLVVLFCSGYGSSSMVNVGNDLAGRIIHIESIAARGKYLDSMTHKTYINLHPRYFTLIDFGLVNKLRDYIAVVWSDWIYYRDHNKENLYYEPRTQFKVKKADKEGHVVLESVKWPGWYITKHFTSKLRIGKTSYPFNKKDYQWKITCEGNQYNRCLIGQGSNYITIRYAKVTIKRGKVITGYYGKVQKKVNPHSYVRLHAPNPEERYATLMTTANGLSTPIEKTITYSEGMTDTRSTTKKLSVSVTAEVSAAFKVVSAKLSTTLSSEWTSMSSKTFQKTTSISYKITIPPKTKLIVKQLTGTYGPFKVATKHMKYEEEKIL